MPNTKRCFCEDWESFGKAVVLSVKLIKTTVMTKRDGIAIEDWEFVRNFKFCPWCGSPLAESKEEWEKIHSFWSKADFWNAQEFTDKYKEFFGEKQDES